MNPVETKKMVLKVDVDHPKLQEAEFYHILFSPKKRIELDELPILFEVNGQDWELFDIAQYQLIELDDQLIRLATRKSKQHYLISMKQKHGRRASDDCMMLVGKFRRID